MNPINKQYLLNARECLEGNDILRALVLLKHIDQIEEEVSKLTLTAAYSLWASIQNDPSRRQQFIRIVIEAYTRILESGNHKLMAPIDYINLSHIYISEGALEAGLRVLQLGSARGHFENVAIVLQIWTILKTLDNSKDQADANMNFLVSSMLSYTGGESYDEDIVNTNLKLEHIMLHCASYIRIKFLAETREKLRKPLYDKFRVLVTEVYIMWTRQTPQSMQEVLSWFDDSSIWVGIGRELEPTPFGILLAEETYWQAFLRKPLEPGPLNLILDSMKKYGRENYSRNILERAIRISPWHVQCREWLKHLDEEEGVPDMFSWSLVFDSQELSLSKIQSCIRGYLFRKWWVQGKLEYVLRKQQALKQLNKSGKAFLVQRDRRRFQIFKQWREMVALWKDQKCRAATKLQSYWRRVWAQYCYSWAAYRVRRANCIFLIASQQYANTNRVRLLRVWQDAATLSLRRRSATTIIRQLRADRSFQGFHKSVTLLMGLLEIRKRIYNRTNWENWRKIYIGRQRKHAMMTIRFYIRDNYMVRNKPVKKETKAQLEARMQVIETLVAKTITLNPKTKLRPAWRAWRLELHKVRAQRARVLVAKLLPILFRRRKHKLLVKSKRVRLEGRIAGLEVARRNRSFKPYKFLRRYAASQILQRFARCAVARKILARKKMKMSAVFNLRDRCYLEWCRSLVRRWKKFIFLWKRVKLRARKRIIRTFQIARCKRVVVSKCYQKLFTNALLTLLHQKFLFMNFHRLKMNTIIQFRIDTLIPFCSALNKFQLRHGWLKWRKFDADQSKLHRLATIFITSKLDGLFWRGCHHSISEDSAMDAEPASLFGPVIDLSVEFVTWEKPIPPSTRIWNNGRMFQKLRVFKTWMAMYRQKCRDRRYGSRVLVAAVVPMIMSSVLTRILKRIKIQSKIRQCLAKRNFRNRIRCRRIVEEMFRSRHIAAVKALLLELHDIAKRQAQCRIQIQCAWRISIAKARAAVLRKQSTKIRRAYSILTTSSARKVLMKTIMGYWLAAFARKTFVQVHHQLLYKRHVAESNTLNRPKSGDPSQSQTLLLTKRMASSTDFRLSEPTAPPLMSRSMTLPLSGAFPSPQRNDKIKKQAKTQNRSQLVQSMREQQDKFQSTSFHAKLFQLRQTGIFMYDAHNREDIVLGELEFFISNCETFIFQNVLESSVQPLLANFRGSKVILCGGLISKLDMEELLAFLKRQNSPLYLHFGSIYVQFRSALEFVSGCCDGDSVRLKELSVDLTSFGCLGLALLLTSMKDCRGIESLVVMCAKSSWFPGFAGCLELLAGAHQLQELRLHGAPFSESELNVLLRVLRDGFQGLRLLEICTTNDEVSGPLAEEVLNLAKRKSMISTRGLSVRLNVV